MTVSDMLVSDMLIRSISSNLGTWSCRRDATRTIF